MIVIPAIDIRGGKCVRLLHGDFNEETVYSDDPVAMARKWIAAGAKRLHVIDLDGAASGVPTNLDLIVRIRQETGIPIQTGGGIRSMETIDRILSAGIDRVILGSAVVDEAGVAKDAFDRYKSRIMVALDAKDGRVAIHGWKEDSGFPIEEALSIVEKLGGSEIIFTDIGRDGTLEGVNVGSVSSVMKKTRLAVYASGGVSTISDIQRLKTMGSPGCVVGKAIYEGRLDLAEAIRLAES